jgi:vacuolar-type H+-ATPase subunit I/STV1
MSSSSNKPCFDLQHHLVLLRRAEAELAHLIEQTYDAKDYHEPICSLQNDIKRYNNSIVAFQSGKKCEYDRCEKCNPEQAQIIINKEKKFREEIMEERKKKKAQEDAAAEEAKKAAKLAEKQAEEARLGEFEKELSSRKVNLDFLQNRIQQTHKDAAAEVEKKNIIPYIINHLTRFIPDKKTTEEVTKKITTFFSTNQDETLPERILEELDTCNSQKIKQVKETLGLQNY